MLRKMPDLLLSGSHAQTSANMVSIHDLNSSGSWRRDQFDHMEQIRFLPSDPMKSALRR